MSAIGTVASADAPVGPIPKTMRAGVYREKGMVRVEEIPVPDVRDHEVLIKVAACGICGTDIKKIFQRYVEPPQVLGHELAGTVVAIGPGVTKFKPGDRVMSFHHTPCGTCFYCEKRSFSQCQQYKTTGLTAGFTPNGGGFGEYVKAMPWVVERGIVPLPDNVSFEEATFIEPINTIASRTARPPRLNISRSILRRVSTILASDIPSAKSFRLRTIRSFISEIYLSLKRRSTMSASLTPWAAAISNGM